MEQGEKTKSAVEYISHEKNDREAWVCICGNRPVDGGFFACDANGYEIEPDEGGWNVPLYVCDICGRVIHKETLEVVRRRNDPQNGMFRKVE